MFGDRKRKSFGERKYYYTVSEIKTLGKERKTISLKLPEVVVFCGTALTAPGHGTGVFVHSVLLFGIIFNTLHGRE